MSRRCVYAMIAALLALTSCESEWEGPTRTVLYYAVKSNLGSDIEHNIADMESVATNKNIKGNLLIFTSDSRGKAELYRIVPGRRGGKKRERVADFSGRSGVDTKTLTEVIATAVSRFPADSYGLAFSSHGTSWLPSDVKQMQRVFGEERGKWMDIKAMAEAIPDGMFEFIIFDACSMGSIECAYEFRHDCDYYISSPSEILTLGFPYKKIVPYMFDPHADYSRIAEAYNNYYMNSIYPYADISVVKSERLGQLASTVRDIIGERGETALYDIDTEGLQMLSSLKYSPTDFYDLEEAYLRIETSDSLKREVLSKCIEQAIPTALHTGQHFCGRRDREIPIRTFCGLSVYPMREELTKLNEEYRKLDWYKEAVAAQ